MLTNQLTSTVSTVEYSTIKEADAVLEKSISIAMLLLFMQQIGKLLIPKLSVVKNSLGKTAEVESFFQRVA